MGATTSVFDGCISHGPWGGPQGKQWTYMPEGCFKKITVVYGEVIDSIKFDQSGGQISIFGGNGGNKTAKICIDYPNEYLTSISGTIGSYEGSDVVMSLCFVTNHKRYGPYGTNSGLHFAYEGEGGVIVGFNGKADKFLSAFGIYVMPKSLALRCHQKSKFDGNPIIQLCSSMSAMAMPREAGPWGAWEGRRWDWDDGVFSGVKQVRVHVGVFLNVIHAIQVEYLKKDSKSVLSQIHGGTNGEKIELVDLDVTNEYLIGISGFYGRVKGYKEMEAIVSITLHTNKSKHGPFGLETGAGYSFFASTAHPGKIVGFHGRHTGFLSAIGVHMEYF